MPHTGPVSFSIFYTNCRRSSVNDINIKLHVFFPISFRALGPGMQFQHKLHIVYLVNDILHHCQRKGAQDLQKALQDVVVPLFFVTQLGESPENLQKVTKVLGIWESHNLFEPSLLQVNF